MPKFLSSIVSAKPNQSFAKCLRYSTSGRLFVRPALGSFQTSNLCLVAGFFPELATNLRTSTLRDATYSVTLFIQK